MLASLISGGMGWVLVLWLVGVGVLLRAALSGATGFRLPALADLHRDETGVSYSMSYILVAPIYLMFLCMVFTATLLLLAKIGTMYAAHAGARSAAVWQTAQPSNLRQERTEQAVLTAMAPFVSASSRDLLTAPSAPPPNTARYTEEFIEGYTFYSRGSKNLEPPVRRPYARQQPDPGYLARKFLNTATRTTFRIGGETNRPGGKTTVTVTYKSPLYIPGVNRFLDPDGAWPYAMDITSVAAIPSEVPVSANRTLGIPYRSR